jgi:transposase
LRPPKFPDIPPIENLWARAKIKIAENGIYNNEEELWLAICDAWIEIMLITLGI